MALYYTNTDGQLEEVAGLGYLDGNNVGTIVSYAGTDTPVGYLDCDGSAVSRTTYAELFAVIGTTYGAGDGSTTFNLPNLTDKYLKGKGAKSVGANQAAGLPNIVGYIQTVLDVGSGTGGASGAFSSTTKMDSNGATGSGGNRVHFRLDANKYNPIYADENTTVDVDAVIVKFCIKYTKTLGTLAEPDNTTTHNDANGKLAVIYQEMFDMTHPINSVWIQYTADDNPNTLFNVEGKYASTWTDITPDYAGRYFKADSGNAVGTQIAAGLPLPTIASGGEHTHNLTLGWTEPSTMGGNWRSVAKSDSIDNIDITSAGSHTHSITADSIYKSTNTTVTPLTSTVKVWKRTE